MFDLTWFDGRDLLLLVVAGAVLFHLGRVLGRAEAYDDGYDDGRLDRIAERPSAPVLQLVPRPRKVYDFESEGA